jgi:two-component system cell cycle response regulator
MRYLLAAFDHDVVAVTSGAEGLEILAARAIDVVVCDVQMPHMDGLEFLRHVRANERTRDLPVIAVTAAAMAGDRERFKEAGFDDYIPKPIDPTRFVSQVDAHVARAPVSRAT